VSGVTYGTDTLSAVGLAARFQVVIWPQGHPGHGISRTDAWRSDNWSRPRAPYSGWRTCLPGTTAYAPTNLRSTVQVHPSPRGGPLARSLQRLRSSCGWVPYWWRLMEVGVVS